MNYGWPLNRTGLNCAGLLMHGFCSINILESFLEICDNLKKLSDEPCSLEILKKLERYCCKSIVYNTYIKY